MPTGRVRSAPSPGAGHRGPPPSGPGAVTLCGRGKSQGQLRARPPRPAEYKVLPAKRRSKFRGIPEDLLGIILAYAADPHTLCRCAGVNRAWRRLADSDALWALAGAAAGGAKRPAAGQGWKALRVAQACGRARHVTTQLRTKALRTRERSLKAVTEGLALDGWCVRVGRCDARPLATEVWHFAAAVCFRLSDLPTPLQSLTGWERAAVSVDCFARKCDVRARVLRCDDLGHGQWAVVRDTGTVRLLRNPRLLSGRLWLGIWGADSSVGFALCSIPSHALLATFLHVASYIATPCAMPHIVVPDDVDREYGLHDYTVTFALRTPGKVKFEQQFPHVFTHLPPTFPAGGFLPSIRSRSGPAASSRQRPPPYFRLQLLDTKHWGHSDWSFDRVKRGPRAKAGQGLQLHLPVRFGGFTAALPLCILVDVVVWDEHQEVMWAATEAVALETLTDGLHYDLPDGTVVGGAVEEPGRARLAFELLQPHHHPGEEGGAEVEGPGLIMYGLHLDLSVPFVNQWYGTNYSMNPDDYT